MDSDFLGILFRILFFSRHTFSIIMQMCRGDITEKINFKTKEEMGTPRVQCQKHVNFGLGNRTLIGRKSDHTHSSCHVLFKMFKFDTLLSRCEHYRKKFEEEVEEESEEAEEASASSPSVDGLSS